ncbi:MAG: hydroxyethylthiazole kinase [Actinomycetota bacterium]
MASEILAKVRRERPLIHNITNFVVMNETANIILCAGALPVMAHAKEEVAEMASQASGLVLNIGTLTPELVESMILAGRAANKKGLPVVLDPVGAGATKLRTDSAGKILREVDVTVVRGNAAEIAILAGSDARIVGVESVEDRVDALTIASNLAVSEKNVVAVTGAVDLVTDGNRIAWIHNGHPMMGRVTGTGCMATAMISVFLAVHEDVWEAAAAALGVFGLAGEMAAVDAPGPGTFHTNLYDALAGLTPESIYSNVRIETMV